MEQTVDTQVAAMRDGAGLVDLPEVEAFLLEAEDARRWCNGMFTNNVKQLRPGQGNRHAMCDDRGRVGGLLDLYCIDDQRFLVILDGLSFDAFQERYKMYLILDDIDLSPATDHRLLSLQGPHAASILGRMSLPAPEEGHARVDGGDDLLEGVHILNRDRTGLGGFDLLMPRERVDELTQAAIRAGAVAVEAAGLDAQRIAHGRAAWPQDGTEKSLIHELRLEGELCSFNKGCYLGQEVINRVDVKGKLPKRMTGLVVEGAIPPVGTEVHLDDKAIGTISSTATLQGKTLALATLRKAAWEPGTCVLVGDSPATTTAFPLA
jgi:folate-binding protein YgfZ